MLKRSRFVSPSPWRPCKAPVFRHLAALLLDLLRQPVARSRLCLVEGKDGLAVRVENTVSRTDCGQLTAMLRAITHCNPCAPGGGIPQRETARHSRSAIMTIAILGPPPPKLASPHRSSTAGYFPRYFCYFFSCLANEFSPGSAAPSPDSALFAFTI